MAEKEDGIMRGEELEPVSHLPQKLGLFAEAQGDGSHIPNGRTQKSSVPRIYHPGTREIGKDGVPDVWNGANDL